MASMQKVFSAYSSRLAAHAQTTASNPFAAGIALIDNTLVPLAAARIPILDQGFLHSDLTYDVPAIWDGRFFRLPEHLARFAASCAKLRLRNPLGPDALRDTLLDMARRCGLRDVYVHLVVTRGLTPVLFADGSLAQDSLGALYVFLKPYAWVMPPEVQMAGTGCAVVARSVRRTPPGAVDPTVKNHQWGDLTRGVLEARDRGAKYPFLTDGDGNLTEGAGYNIVLVKDGVLFTPERGVLEGVTRRCVLDVARANGIEARVEYVPVDLAYSCDEIFMCTTAGGIMPITSLDGQPVKDGKVGPITRVIWDGYWEMHYDPEYSFEVAYDEPKQDGVNGEH